MTDTQALIANLRSSAKAFRENTVYDSEGDPIRLIVQADECDQSATALTDAEAKLAKVREQITELQGALVKALTPQWFYLDGYSSEDCYDSPGEALDYLDLEPGEHVVQIECAGPLPSIWCAVKVRTSEEMDALETDDRVVISEHANEATARACLAELGEG